MISDELQGPGWYSECRVDCWLMIFLKHTSSTTWQHSQLTLDSGWVHSLNGRGWWGDQFCQLVHPFPPWHSVWSSNILLVPPAPAVHLPFFLDIWYVESRWPLFDATKSLVTFFAICAAMRIQKMVHSTMMYNAIMRCTRHTIMYSIRCMCKCCIHVLIGWKHNTGTLQWLHGLFWESLWYRFSSYMGEFHPVRSTHVYSIYIVFIYLYI